MLPEIEEENVLSDRIDRVRTLILNDTMKTLRGNPQDCKRAAISRLLERTLKKVRGTHDESLGFIAEQNFIEFNSKFTEPDLPRLGHGDCVLSEILDIAQEYIQRVLERYVSSDDVYQPVGCTLSPYLWSQHCYFGPKASIGYNRSLPAVEKLVGLTATNAALPYLPILLEGIPLDQQDLVRVVKSIKVVQGGHLGSVPKDVTKARCIMTEPSLNGALQLGLGAYIRTALEREGLHIAGKGYIGPDRNRALARIGSDHGTYSTLDLKNASDSLSDSLVKRLLPSEWYYILRDLRSPSMQLSEKHGKKSADKVTLNVFCTMGNGFTFPLQTLIFTSLCVAVRSFVLRTPLRYLLHKGVDPRGTMKVAVFGDDIIVPTELAPVVVNVLELCGLIVNSEKSFLSGPFRESCGGDYNKGYDVTPCYIRDLVTRQGITVAFNGLVKWSVTHNINVDGTLRYLGDLLYERNYFKKVPGFCNPDEGIIYPSSKVRSKFYKCYRAKPRTFDKFVPDLRMYQAISGSYRTDFQFRDVGTDYSKPAHLGSPGDSELLFRVSWTVASEVDTTFQEVSVPVFVSWEGSGGDCYYGRLVGLSRQRVCDLIDKVILAIS